MSTFEAGGDAIALLQSWASATSVDVFRTPGVVPLIAKWNIVAADSAGNIFYIFNGRIAHKSEAYDWGRPVDGTTSATEWSGLMTMDELPQLLNPARGYLQNANNPPWATAPELDPDDYPLYLGRGTGLNDRGNRAVELLEADPSFTVEEVKVMGMDDLSISGRNVAPLLVQTWAERQASTPDPDGSLAQAMTLIGAWDYTANRESHAYAVYRLWHRDFFALSPGISASNPPPFSGLSEAAKDKMIQALQSSTAEMKSKFGTVDKRWGDVHVIQRGGNFGVGGGNSTLPTLRMAGVDSYSTSAQAWVATGGSSYMFVAAMSDPVELWSVRPLGQSENPSSPHYNDQTALYAANQYKRVWMTRADVEANAISSVTLAYNGPNPDTDGDGCGDVTEIGDSPSLGGDRDPADQYDFYDVPTPALRLNPSGARDSGIGVTSDVVALLAYAGLYAGQPDYDADYDVNGVADGLQYDRSPSATPGKPWRSGPPDGGIGVTTDVVAMLAQAGHSCAAPP